MRRVFTGPSITSVGAVGCHRRWAPPHRRAAPCGSAEVEVIRGAPVVGCLLAITFAWRNWRTEAGDVC